MEYEILDPVTGRWTLWIPWPVPAAPPVEAEADTPHIVGG
jgi:hypothetical protein